MPRSGPSLACFIKEGVATEFGSQEALTDLLRFHSSKVGEEAWTSLKQYVERMGEEQKAIYYVLGESLRSVARSPHLDYFRAHNIEVLYLVDPLDGYMVSMLREYDGKQLQNVDDANLDLPAPDKSEESQAQEVGQEDFDKLLARVKQVLGERVREVRASKTLVDHAGAPCHAGRQPGSQPAVPAPFDGGEIRDAGQDSRTQPAAPADCRAWRAWPPTSRMTSASMPASASCSTTCC